jgi:hypothetical protein
MKRDVSSAQIVVMPAPHTTTGRIGVLRKEASTASQNSE